MLLVERFECLGERRPFETGLYRAPGGDSIITESIQRLARFVQFGKTEFSRYKAKIASPRNPKTHSRNPKTHKEPENSGSSNPLVRRDVAPEKRGQRAARGGLQASRGAPPDSWLEFEGLVFWV